MNMGTGPPDAGKVVIKGLEGGRQFSIWDGAIAALVSDSWVVQSHHRNLRKSHDL